IVSENFTRIHGLGEGDTLELPGRDGPVRLRILGTIVDYNWIRGTIIVDRVAYRRAFAAEDVSTWEVYLPAGADAKDVAEKLSKSEIGALYSLVGVTRQQVRDNYRDLIRTLYGLAYTQVLVVGVVAVLGVILSLLISVLSRQRELGLIRAVGGTRGQIIHTVLAEAVLIGVIGTVLGVLIGLPLKWYVVPVFLFEGSGFIFPVGIPWLEMGVTALVSIVSAALAGLVPARWASRLNITDAIADE